METEKIIEKLNIACNIMDSLRAELINESAAPKKKSKKKKDTAPITDALNDITKELSEMGELNRELTIKQTLEKYGQPIDDEHVQSVARIVNSNGITLKQLENCLERVKYANDKEPKDDIKKYTYYCLYKEGKQ